MSRRVAFAWAVGAALVLGVAATLAISLVNGSPAPSRDASVAGSGPYRGSAVPGGITMRTSPCATTTGDPSVRAISPVV